MFVRFASRISLFALSAMLAVSASAGLGAQSAPAAVPSSLTLQGGAFGQTVALSWTPAAGATSYAVGVGVLSDSYTMVQDVGAALTVSVTAPPGVYFVRVAGRNAEGIGTPSNEITVVVSPPVGPPPAPPSGLQAQASGQTVALGWSLGQGGGAATALIFAVGSSPGASNLGFIPLRVGDRASTKVPQGTYFTRLFAGGPGGISAPSNEVTVTVGPAGCGAPEKSTLSADVQGTSVGLSWSAAVGAAGYRLDVAATPGGPLILSQGYGAATTSVSVPAVAPGTYYARIVSVSACGVEAPGDEVSIAVAAAPPGTNRTPDPAPGQRLPLPNPLGLIQEVARAYPGDLRNSCREQGGNNTFLFRVVQRLRQEDTRWGLNWKRANRGDMSQDVVNYHWGAGPDEDSTDTYVGDIIVGHCGGNPGVTFNNVTGVGGAGARWTLQPYSQAGFQP